MIAKIVQMSSEEYHAAEGLSNTGIQLLLNAPRKYWYKYILNQKVEKTAAQRAGELFHTFMLERDELEKRYHIIPGDKILKTSKVYKEALEICNGRDIICEGDIEELEQMYQSIISIPDVTNMLKDGKAEQSIFWEDEETGIILKTRPDYINERVKAVFDLKTTVDASESAFQRSIYNYGYHVQAALAIDGLFALTGENYDASNIAIEKEPPYCAAPYLHTDHSIDIGRKLYRKAIKIYLHCKENNKWPSYVDELKEIGLPYWAENQLAEDLI